MFYNLLASILLLTNLFNINTEIKYTSILKYFYNSNEIIMVIDNNNILCDNNNKDKITNSINNVCKNSHEAPAFCVSLHEYTTKNIQSGTWLIFKYNTTQWHNELPFDELVIEVNPDYYGFNIIRKYNGRYDGRCFYLHLENNMLELYDTIQKINTQNNNLT